MIDQQQIETENSSEKATKDELISLLEFEIARLENEQQRPGWTKWALGGAIASCTWLLLDQFEAHADQINISYALFLFLIWVFIWDTLIVLKRFLSSRSLPVNLKAGFWFTNIILSEARFLLFGKFIEKTCLLAIIWTCPLIPHNWIFYTASAVFIGSLFSISVGLLLSYKRFRISNDRPKNTSLLAYLNFFGSIPAIVVLFKYIQIAIKASSQFSIVDLRVSLLLFAFSIIAPLLLKDKIHYPFLTALLDLRRKLALQEINCEDARKQANIFFKGMDAKVSLQEDVDLVLLKYRTVTATLAIIFNEVTALTSSGNQPVDQNDNPRLYPLVSQIPNRLECVEQLLKEAEDAKSSLKSLVVIMGWMSPSSEPEMLKLFETVDLSTAETKTSVQAKIEDVKLLLNHQKMPMQIHT